MTQFLYAFKNDVTGFIKVGISNNPEKRRKALECACGCHLKVIFVIKPVESATKVEREIHYKLKDYRQLGEWFNCSESIVIKAAHSFDVKARYKRTPRLMKQSWYHKALRKRFS